MTIANASQGRLSYVEETAFGTTPGSPSMLKFRATGWSLSPSATTLVSEERRADGQVPMVRQGVKRAGGTINCEALYLALKDMLRAALRYDTSSGSFTSTAGTDTAFASSTKKITRTSGDWTSDGAAVNMKIRVTGSTSNDGVYTINTVTALEITVDEALTDETAGQDVKMQGELAEPGTHETHFTLESALTDAGVYERYTGMTIGSMSINAPVDALATMSFEMMGEKLDNETSQLGAPSDVDTGDPIATPEGTISEGGSAIAILTAMDLQANWNRGDRAVLGSDAVVGVRPGRLEVTGNVTAFIEDATLFDKFLDETETSLEFSMEDPDGNALNVWIPAMKYTGGSHDLSGDEDIALNLPFQAYVDATTGKSIIINMIPATAT